MTFAATPVADGLRTVRSIADRLRIERAAAVALAAHGVTSVRLGNEVAAGSAHSAVARDHGLRHVVPPLAPAINPLPGWLASTADTLTRTLAPLGATGLVPGDSCPDNAIYADGRLTLIDFESAAHRPVAWAGAYLIVPWPTCWCCWALPDSVVERVPGPPGSSRARPRLGVPRGVA